MALVKVKTVIDRDEHTLAQRRRVDAQFGKSVAEFKEGKSFGPRSRKGTPTKRRAG